MNIQTFNFSVDLLKVILWQYNDAEKIQKLLTQKQNWYNAHQTHFWQNWYTDVFDLRTANDFGLSVWAIILDMPIIAEASASDADAPAFGFTENYRNFENGNYFAAQSSQLKLTTAQKRIILQLRYFQLISKGTVPEINRFLQALLGKGYVIDTYNMGYVLYVLDENISSEIKFVLEQFDLLPRPAAVGVKIIYTRTDIYGFESNYQNFNNGMFADYDSYN